MTQQPASQPPKSQKISAEQLDRTFRTNIFSMFFLVKAALKHLQQGSVIINTTSVTAYKGNPSLLDYSSTKGAIVSFTRSLCSRSTTSSVFHYPVHHSVDGHEPAA